MPKKDITKKDKKKKKKKAQPKKHKQNRTTSDWGMSVASTSTGISSGAAVLVGAADLQCVIPMEHAWSNAWSGPAISVITQANVFSLYTTVPQFCIPFPLPCEANFLIDFLDMQIVRTQELYEPDDDEAIIVGLIATSLRKHGVSDCNGISE
jgi:hypothetical protein